MPFLKIQTNRELALDSAKDLASKASALVACQLGKPESYVMTSVENNPAMTFAGTDEPLAFLELKSIELPEAITADTSRALCELVSAETAIDAARIYIEFSDAPRRMWGWNKGTF